MGGFNKSKNTFQTFAGIIFALSVVTIFVSTLLNILGASFSGFEISWAIHIYMPTFILQLLPLSVLAVMCLMKKQNFIFILPACLLAIFSLYRLINTMQVMSIFGVCEALYNFLTIIACIIYVLSIVSNTVEGAKNLKEYKKIFSLILTITLIAGAVILILCSFIHRLIDLIDYGLPSSTKEWLFLFYNLFDWAGIIFMAGGLILSNLSLTANEEDLSKTNESNQGEDNKDDRTYEQKQLSDYDLHYVSILKHILLLIFTFGIWQFIWIYRVSKNLSRIEGFKEEDPVVKLILCLLVPFYMYFWIYNYSKRIDEFSKLNGVDSNNATICLVISFFIPFITYVMMQNQINNAVEIKKQATEQESCYGNQRSNPKLNKIEEIKKYKELLDQGVITQEEFEYKKKELLGLQ